MMQLLNSKNGVIMFQSYTNNVIYFLSRFEINFKIFLWGFSFAGEIQKDWFTERYGAEESSFRKKTNWFHLDTDI